MLTQATVVRVDPPGSAMPGNPIVVQAALTALSATDLAWLDVNGLQATAAIYLPLHAGTPAIAADAVIAIRQGDQPAIDWLAVHAADFVGAVSRFRKVFVKPSGA